MNTTQETVTAGFRLKDYDYRPGQTFNAVKVHAISSRPNRLMYGMVVLSLLLHGVLLFHSEIFKAKQTSYIELTMQYIPKKVKQTMPAPLPPQVVSRKSIAEVPQKALKTAQKKKRIRPVAKLVANIPEIPKPLVTEAQPNITSPSVATVVPAAQIAPSLVPEISIPDRRSERLDYLSMIQQRIEQHKSYPLVARRRQIEGRVGVRFVISPSGQIDRIEISRSSEQEILDRAAVKAVRETAPLPVPPTGLFLKATPIELTIVFKLI